MSKTQTIGQTSEIARWLALGAVAGPVIYTFAWFILGFISSGYTIFGTYIPTYSPITQPISGLGMSSTAVYMNSAFELLGILLILGAYGVFKSIPGLSPAARWTAAILLALPGIGAIIDGIFNLEAFMIHFVGFGLVLTTTISFAVVGLMLHRLPAWRRFGGWLVLASPLTLGLTIFYFATFNPEAAGAGVGIGGLTQRILIVEILAWYVALGWHSFRQK